MAVELDRLSDGMRQALRANCDQTLEVLRGYRLSWQTHWSQCADVYLPRRHRWFVTPNQYARGMPINATIVDETGVLAARTCATGMLSGLTSPDKHWFDLGIHGVDTIPEGAAKIWLAESTRRMHAVLGGSNFYTIMGQAHHDNVVFGSACILEYEDKEDVIRFYNPCLGEFYFALDERLVIDTIYREYTYTVKQAVDAFGIENVSESTRQMYKNETSRQHEIVMGHCIEPNKCVFRSGEPIGYPVAKKFRYREVFWERTGGGGYRTGSICKVAGFNEQPFFGMRWDVTSNDPYGRSPGMEGLPASRQLQVQQRRKAEALEKLVRPPMVGSNNLKNEPQDTLPGGITYVASLDGSGFKPAYQVDPHLQEMSQDIRDVQERLKEVFFVDLFMMISNLQTVRTATEIDARREEKLLLLGPVIERIETEVLDKIIMRTFAIMMRRGLFEPVPPELHGATIAIRYISMLAEVQKASETTLIERLFQFAAGLVAVQPQVMDKLDSDKGIEIYADRLGAPPDMLRSDQAVAQIRAQRQQEQQQQAALQTGAAAAQGAQVLSKTDVGGGQNALQSIMGVPAGGAPGG